MKYRGDTTTDSADRGGPSRGVDMLSLSMARMPELVAALEDDRTLSDTTAAIPRRSKRVARLLMTEAIRLIRLGTRAEVADAALELAQLLTRPSAKRLAEQNPAAHRLLTSAADALAAAAPASSGGSELAVLRSWNGKALRAVAMVSKPARRAVPRADLRARLEVSESYLSHLLADLEAAGLVVRVKSGHTVMVHLGLVGRSAHVQDLLPRDPDDREPERVRAGTQWEQEEVSQSSRLGSLPDTDPLRDNELPPPLDADELVRAAVLDEHIYKIDNVSSQEPLVLTGATIEVSTASLSGTLRELGSKAAERSHKERFSKV